MKATHTDYMHPKHLRVEDGGEVFCLSPSHSQYDRLNKSSLPSFMPKAPDTTDFSNRYSKCADIPGWLITTEVFDLGTKLGVAIWNGKDGAERRRHAVRSDSFSAAVEQLKEWADAA